MKLFRIGIGGGSSGAGKTTIACTMLQHLEGWGAIKYTRTDLYSSIIDDIHVLSEEGKDTRRLLDSGAEKVLWVRSPFSDLSGVLSMAMEMLSHLRGVIIEGNSAIQVLNPDIVIFALGPEGEIKAAANAILNIADIVIAEKEPLPALPETAKLFYRSDIERCIDYILGLIQVKQQ